MALLRENKNISNKILPPVLNWGHLPFQFGPYQLSQPHVVKKLQYCQFWVFVKKIRLVASP